MSHTSCLSVLTLSVISITPISPSSNLHHLISSLSVALYFFLQLLFSLVLHLLSFFGLSHPSPLSHLRLSHNFFFFSPFFSVSLLTTHSVCQNQTIEPRKCHTNNVRVSISVSRGDTFINERSRRPCRCSITFAGACPWGAQHVRCEQVCVRA